MTGARYGAIFKKEKEKSGYRNKINTRAHLFFFTTPALAVIQFG
jgi:hypothetical protein